MQQLVGKGHDAASAEQMARKMSPGDMQVWTPERYNREPLTSMQVCDIVTLLPACDRSCWVSVSMHVTRDVCYV